MAYVKLLQIYFFGRIETSQTGADFIKIFFGSKINVYTFILGGKENKKTDFSRTKLEYWIFYVGQNVNFFVKSEHQFEDTILYLER